jgi:hypothetical protein
MSKTLIYFGTLVTKRPLALFDIRVGTNIRTVIQMIIMKSMKTVIMKITAFTPVTVQTIPGQLICNLVQLHGIVGGDYF